MYYEGSQKWQAQYCSVALKHLDLSRPSVMGIVNVTPDSFSDGGELYDNAQLDLSKTLKVIEKMLADGADIIDIGGESTRPGAAVVSTLSKS